jgi:regulator of sigma E protease
VQDLIQFAWTNGVSFVVVLSVIVFVHEMGHYLVARWNGVRIEVFSLGFGPELYGWNDRRGTRWKLSALPLGGYVKMAGEPSATGKQEALSPSNQHGDAFHTKRVGQRAAVVVAGPAANFLFAAVVLAALFIAVGERVTPPEVSDVRADSPAAAAGFEPGDVIREIAGTPIERFEDIQDIVRASPGVTLDVVVERAGAMVPLQVTPNLVQREDRFGNVFQIGEVGIVRAGGVVYRPLDPASAVWAAVSDVWRISVATLGAVGEMIAGARNADELGGPIRIAQMSGQVAEAGAMDVLWFMAVLSINLGLINLFPVPMLDGGHLVFLGYEGLRGRPLGERAQDVGLKIGLALVVSLMVFATWNDLVQLKVVSFFVNLVS